VYSLVQASRLRGFAQLHDVLLTHLRVGKVHLRVLLLELLQDIRLLLLVAGRLALLLLPLVKHHLLDHAACLSVEVAQLAVLGLYFGGVDLGRGGDDVRPPLHLVDFVEVDGDLLVGADGLECPGGLVDADGVRQRALGRVLDS
jgi:hypothetical protein